MCTSPSCTHDDLNDDLADLLGTPSERTVEVASTRPVDELAKAQQFKGHEEPCKKCRGTGRFVSYTGRTVGDCFVCKGKGKLFYRTSIEQRERARTTAAARKDREVQSTARQAQDWLEANPAEAKWLSSASARGFEFASSLLSALIKYGHFTERQEAAVRNATAKSLAKQADWAAEKATRDVAAPVADVSKVQAALETAKASGLDFPKLRLSGFVFSLAGDASANRGAVYVKGITGTYLGKVAQGRFSASRDCDEVTGAAILAAAADPEASAAAYGLQTGICSCCGRKLTNKESVGLGIGPICRGRFGF